MSLRLRIDGSLIDNRVRLTGGSSGGIAGFPSTAWYCEASTAGLVIDDPLGELDLRGWHTFTAEETLSVGHERIFSGWLTGMRVSRGVEMRGRARVWDCDIIDLNALFSLEVFRANSAQRPAETDVARVLWGIASAPMAGTPVHNYGRLNTGGALNLGAAAFVPEFPIELFSSSAAQAGKNVYAYWSDADDGIGIHYDLIGVGPAAGIGISNVVADVDNVTTFYPYRDGSLDRDPSLIVTGLLFGYLGGYVYGRNAAKIDELSPTEFSPVNFLRDDVYRSDRVGRVTTANALLAQYLSDRSIERDTIKVTLRLPAAKVGQVHAGDTIVCRFTHLPGYEVVDAAVSVTRMSIRPSPGRRDSYDVELELANYGTARGPAGGDPSGYPHQDCSAADFALVQAVSVPEAGFVDDGGGAAHIVLPAAPIAGNRQLVMFEWNIPGTYANGPTPTGWTDVSGVVQVAPTFQNLRLRVWERVAEAGDTTTLAMTGWTSTHNVRGAYLEFSGLGDRDSFDTEEITANNPSPMTLGTVSPAAGGIALVGFLVPANNVNDGWSAVPADGSTEDVDYGAVGSELYEWAGHRFVDHSGGSLDMRITPTHGGITRGFGSVLVAYSCTGSDVPPQAGMHVRNELVWIGDDVTSSGTTRFPYAANSLKVYVDGVPIINGLTQTDPSAGTFALDFIPKGVRGDTRAERVTVDYQVAP